MKKVSMMWFCLCCLVIFTFLVAALFVSAGELEKLSVGQFSQLARGGILYDNWPAEVGIKIKETHPSYPAVGKKKGGSTWRCKECHGWDYKGRAGAYRKGSHYTGIIGIRAYAGQAPEEIVRILKNDVHAFGNMIPEEDLNALALFVSLGQIDMDPYIDRATKQVAGDPVNGAKIFLAVCAKCHGEDGKEINFKTKEKPEYIGTVSNKNPWETLHKIRWGHPGTPMTSLLFHGLKGQLDVLLFSQTLP